MDEGAAPGLRPASVRAWLRMIRVVQRVNRAAAEQLAAEGLTLPQFDVLTHIGAAEGLTQQQLAGRLLVTEGNITQLLVRLEQRGLLKRTPSGHSKRLSLTPVGRALFARTVHRHEALIAEKLDALSDAEARELHRLLRRVDRSLAE